MSAVLKLFKLDTGGAVYWLAAEMSEDCVHLIAKCEGCTVADICDDPPNIEELDPVACATKLRDENDATSRPLRDFFREAKEPCVLGCSEWP